MSLQEWQAFVKETEFWALCYTFSLSIIDRENVMLIYQNVPFSKKSFKKNYAFKTNQY